MGAPTSYTETTLKQFMIDELGAVATLLGLTTASTKIVNAVTFVERILDASVADVTELAKLEDIARWRAWHTARATAVGQYDLSSSGDSLKRSQVWDHLVGMLAEAEAAVMQYEEVAPLLAGASFAYVESLSTAASPYAWASSSSEFD